MNSNTIKTMLLLSSMTFLIIVVGYLLGGTIGLLVSITISLFMNFGSYWFSSKIALSFASAKEVSKDELPYVYQDLESISQMMEIPTPKLYISPNPQPNAFATGRNPENGVVCLTEGILNTLDRQELRGVIAHELAHIKNRDILLSTIAATLAGVITSITDIFMFNSLFGGSQDEEGGVNPIGGIILMILAPIASIIIQMSISRAREYEADSLAVKTLRNKEGLSNALIKIDGIAKNIPARNINTAFAPLYISNPLSANSVSQLFSTHPPTEKRVNNIMNTKI